MTPLTLTVAALALAVVALAVKVYGLTTRVQRLNRHTGLWVVVDRPAPPADVDAEIEHFLDELFPVASDQPADVDGPPPESPSGGPQPPHQHPNNP